MNMNELQPISRGPFPHPVASGENLYATQVSVAEMPGPGLKRDYSGFLEYWQMIRRHRGAVILATFLGGVMGFLLTLSAPRIFQARTTLEIQGLNDDFLNMRNVNPTSADASTGYIDTYIQTQVKILQSNLIVSRVVQKMQTTGAPQNLQPPDRLGVWRKTLGIHPPSSDALWRQAHGT